jgi:Alpha amylase, catalytic domain
MSRTLLILLATLVCCAPVEVRPGDGRPDEPMPPDAGPESDAGAGEPDTGVLEDAGLELDSGVVVDAGTPTTDGGASTSWRQRVIYLVMPDRFFNGDPSNDQTGAPNCLDRADPRRFHGGDFAGLRAKLPYLRDLGITALWMTPANLQIGRTGGGRCVFRRAELPV